MDLTSVSTRHILRVKVKEDFSFVQIDYVTNTSLTIPTMDEAEAMQVIAKLREKANSHSSNFTEVYI